jgi:hypothetical protein
MIVVKNCKTHAYERKVNMSMLTNRDFYSSLALAASQPPMPHDPVVVSTPTHVPDVVYGPSLHVLVSASAPFPHVIGADAAPSLLVAVAQMIVHLQHLVDASDVVVHPVTYLLLRTVALHLEQSAC